MIRRYIGSIFTMCLVSLFCFPLLGFAAEGHGEMNSMSAKEVMVFEGEHDSVWHLKAAGPLLIGGYGDNFNYDGSNVTPLLGNAEVILDAALDTGTAVVKLQGSINPEKDVIYSGDIMLVFRVKKGGPAFHEGGVADFIYLHGDTGQDAPVMPKTRTFLATWGETDVYVNGQLIYQNLMGHVMYTERSRDLATRAIYNSDRSDFFSPKDPANGSIAAPDEREIHFVAHNMKKDAGNFPPHAAWIHLNFSKVVEIEGGKAGCSLSRCKLAGKTCGSGCNCGCSGQAEVTKERAPCEPGCGCGCLLGGPCSCGNK